MLLGGAGALAGAGLLRPGALLAQEPISIAGIYTVPVEQQWVSRIHLAAEAARAWLAPQYDYVERRLGALPAAWRAQAAKV